MYKGELSEEKKRGYESIPAKPCPKEEAIQATIEDLNPTLPKLKEMKPSDFIRCCVYEGDREREIFYADTET